MQSTMRNATHGQESVSGHKVFSIRQIVWGTATVLLILPFVLMQFMRDINWIASDFAVMGFMLLTACSTYEFAVWLNVNIAYRAAFGIALAASFILVFLTLAVGIIGDENNPPNLLFAGVLAVGFVGAIRARFRPRGMSRALVATAIAQALVGVVAAAANWGYEAAALGAFFCAMWLISASLFRNASLSK